MKPSWTVLLIFFLHFNFYYINYLSLLGFVGLNFFLSRSLSKILDLIAQGNLNFDGKYCIVDGHETWTKKAWYTLDHFLLDAKRLFFNVVSVPVMWWVSILDSLAYLAVFFA